MESFLITAGGLGGAVSSWDYTIYEALKWLHEKNYAPKKVGGHGPPVLPAMGTSYQLCLFLSGIDRSYMLLLLEQASSLDWLAKESLSKDYCQCWESIEKRVWVAKSVLSL